MISKFDNLLLILNRSFNALPGNEIMTYMMSPTERAFVVQTFHTLAPRYVFTDIDILAPTTDELIDPNLKLVGGFHTESFMRTERINNLKILFRELSPGYKLVESRGLLSVWEKAN